MQVLILLPMRNMALKCVLRLLQITQKETRTDSIQGMRRLREDFGPGEKHTLMYFAPLQQMKILVCNTCPVYSMIALLHVFQRNDTFYSNICHDVMSHI